MAITQIPPQKPFDENEFRRQLSDEYKILQDKIDKIGGSRFTIKGWSITAVIAASAASSASKSLATAITKEIEAYFEMWGFSLGKAEDQPKLSLENSELQDKEPHEEGSGEQEADEDSEDMHGDGDDSNGGKAFDREEIEVATDVFLSVLVQRWILPEYPKNKPPRLEEVFKKVFGEGHDIIKTVQGFEEHIEGYFDVVGYDDMETAANQLSEIRDMINRELGR